MSKTLDQSLDELLDSLDLPSPEEVKKEIAQANRTNGIRRNIGKIKQGIKQAHQNPEVKQRFQKAIANRDQSFRQDESYKQRKSKTMKDLYQDPEYKQRHQQSIEAVYYDPERLAKYKENYAKGNQAKYDKPEYWTNYYQAIAKRDADPEYHKRRIEASKAKICKRVHTPAGIFDSITLAAQHYNLNPEGMRHRIKSKNYPDFYIIEK